MTRYYDLVLGAIPLAVFGVSGLLVGLGVAVPVAVSVGSLLAVGLIGHAMFVNAPTNVQSDRAEAPFPRAD